MKKSEMTASERWAIQAKCGAKNRKGSPCQGLAMKNGRCKLHGGKSTGAKTKEGIQRIIDANLKTGKYTKQSREGRQALKHALRELERIHLH